MFTAEQEQTSGPASGDSEIHYRRIFETAKVGLLEEDFSQVKHEIDSLRRRGIRDLREYLQSYPGEVIRLVGLIRILDANQQALRFHGAQSLTELGGSLEKISVPEALPVFLEALVSLAEGRGFFEGEAPGRTLQGDPIYAVVSFLVPGSDAGFKRLIVSTVDITQRKLTELALRRSEDRYRAIFETARVSLWEDDFSGLYDALEELRCRGIGDIRSYLRDHPVFVKECIAKIRVLDVNRATLDLYKASQKSEFLGSLRKFVTDDALPSFREELAAIYEGESHFEIEQRAFNLRGEEMTILISFSVPKEREAFKRIVVCITDITEHKRIEQEQLRMQRLESLGVLAGGIAHDFNNLLTTVLGNVTLLRHQGGTEPEILRRRQTLLEETEKAIIRAKGLTQQLLTFSRGGAPVKKLVSLRTLLKDSVSFALSGSSVRARFNLAADLLDLELDEGQFTQVINNLVINARQDMHEQGTIEVEAGNSTRADGRSFVRIAVKDHGHGIPQADLARIFDPYFTTKEGGKGLGLAVVFSIVRRHGGFIDVQSEPGKGSCFVIHLPASAERAPRQSARSLQQLDGLCVLVMDDEEPVRTVAARMLEHLGCTVLQAADGEEALAICEQRRSEGSRVDVAIMDLTIPGRMGGKEAIIRLRAQDPQIMAVVSSGYLNDPCLSSFRDIGFQAVLSKPYTLQDIQRVLMSALLR